MSCVVTTRGYAVIVVVLLETVKDSARKGVTMKSDDLIDNTQDPATDSRFPRIMEYAEELDFPEQATPCMTETMEEVNLDGS